MGSDTVLSGRVPRSALDGRLAVTSEITAQPCGPPPWVPEATVANGVPEATDALAVVASLSEENTATVKQAVSKFERCDWK